MHIKPQYALGDVEAARSVIRTAPLATIVTADLRATHMPCLVAENADGLELLGHVARSDPVAEALDGPLLLIFHGAHGYVSASWYARDMISTWNYVILHVRGTPELFDDPLPVLRRTVDHFEAAVEHSWSLDRLQDGGRAMSEKVIAFRLRADSWHAEAKLHQDKPEGDRERVLAGLEGSGPYANPALAAAMRDLGA